MGFKIVGWGGEEDMWERDDRRGEGGGILGQGHKWRALTDYYFRRPPMAAWGTGAYGLLLSADLPDPFCPGPGTLAHPNPSNPAPEARRGIWGHPAPHEKPGIKQFGARSVPRIWGTRAPEVKRVPMWNMGKGWAQVRVRVGAYGLLLTQERCAYCGWHSKWALLCKHSK